MTLFSRRLPHVVTRADLVALLVPTYAAMRGVDEEEAGNRLREALPSPGLVEELYEAISLGLREAMGPRTTEDALLDKVSSRIATRKFRAKPSPDTPGLAAVLVRIDLEIGVAPVKMRATLETPPGRAALEEGMRALGRHLVKELLRG